MSFDLVLKLNCTISAIHFEEEIQNDQNCRNETQASQAPRWRTLLHIPDIPVMRPHEKGKEQANDKSVKRAVLLIRPVPFRSMTG